MSDELAPPDNDSIAAVLAEYLTRIDQGEPIRRETFLAEHPEHTAALRGYFSDVDLIERLAVSLNGFPVAATATPLEFGDYDLVGEIGRGGMGIVYRARERSTDRLVALKMLLHGLFTSPVVVRRFHTEVRAAANLRHSGIMPIYRVGEHAGHLFYTMPLIKGSNLAERLTNGPLEPRTAAKLLLAVVEAVDCAHSHGVVHRDLKPANILLDEHGHTYVADFGLARRLEEDPLGITATGDLLGTPNYMAPEQVNGCNSIVGASADVYALGAVLYALLVGQPPFQSNSISDTLHNICSVDPVRPRQIQRGVPGDLETICLKCLEKSPANRYRSAGELADDLRRFLAGEPLFAQRVSRIERGRRWFVRNPIVGTLAVGIALALFAGAGFSMHYAAQARHRERQALAHLYAADMNLAQQHVRSGAVASALRLLERYRPAHGAKDGPGWEWRQLWRQCHGELRRFEGPQGAVYAAAFSPDGQTVAAAGADQLVWLWETATGKVKFTLKGHAAAVRDIAFAPDGQSLATVGDDCVGLIWNTKTGKRMATLAGRERPLTTVAFSADGSFIATGGNNEGKVDIWDAAIYARRQSLELGPAESLAFSPDDARLAIAGPDGFFRVCQLDDGGLWSLAATVRGHDRIIRDLAWSPDGKRVATAGADRAVKLWDANLWLELFTFGPFKESVYGISFSPDGRRLVAAVRDEPLKVWDVDKPHVGTEIVGHTALVASVDFCPDGWRLVSASEDGTVRLWDAAQATDHNRLEGHQGHVRTVAFSPSGNILASGGLDSAIILWNPKTCQPIRVIRSHAGYISDLEFSPDGPYLAAAEASGHVRIWHVETGGELLDLALNSGPLVSVAWASNRGCVAVLTIDGAVRLIEVTSGRELKKWSSGHGQAGNGSIAFSSDGRLLLTAGGNRSIRIWHVETQSLVHELLGHTAPVVAAVFNAQGSLIASASNDYTIRLWDVATGSPLRTLAGHGGTPFGLAFSADGTRLASSSTDQTVKLWDVATGLELHSLAGHTDWVRDVAFSPDGQQLASAGHDGSVRIWHAAAPTADQFVGGVSDADGFQSSPVHDVARNRRRRRFPQNLSPDDTTTREAAALVKHLAARASAREPLVAVIKADQTINDAVRAAAIRQAGEFQFYWPSMLAGHRAAENRDWAAAADAFERVTTLAPGDVMHWHWLAMASLGADRQETYQGACDELLYRCEANASHHDFFWTFRTWLVATRDDQRLAPLGPLADAYARRFPNSLKDLWLYEMRTSSTPREVLDFTTWPAALGEQAEYWYIVAMACLKAGDKVQALSAYQAGTLRERSGTLPWDWHNDIYRETLLRELEGLLAAEPSPESDARPRATAVPASPSDAHSAVQ